ncbi:MAG: TonB-dependent receptor [Gammaproteobacteria bacterium]
MRSRVSSEVSSDQNVPVRRAVRAILAVGAAMLLASLQAHAQDADAKKDAAKPDEEVTKLSDVEVSEDPTRFLPTDSSGSSFGFAKPILETPRSVSFVSREQIELYDLSSVADLGRVVAGVYTPARYGIEGSIDIRGVPADSYLRGMKRVVLQGNARSVLAAMDSIEVVKGPPSPIFGLGKIGGYTNFVPKSGRAAVGGYLPSDQGFFEAVVGTYARREFSGGVGGPVQLGDKNGGYYIYGLLADSNTYYTNTPADTKMVQAATSFDNFVGPFRLETGAIYQDGTTAGALSGRATQALVDHDIYIKGDPLVNLDLNGNGQIGWREMNTASPVRGNLNADNQPLVQTFNWPKDSAGNYLPLDQFPKVAGIPATMLTYLNAHPEADPTGLLRAQGAGGPVPKSGQVPVGFVLDPRTVGYEQLSNVERRRASAHERELNAKFLTYFADLVYDVNPDFTMKNQLFYDSIHQYKISNQPLWLQQNVWVAEDKFTITKRFSSLPSWLKINNLASVNVRHTESSSGSGYGGDLASTRVDITADQRWISNFEGRIPTTTFVSTHDNPDINDDGSPGTADGLTTYTEYGLGLLWDIDIFEKTNLVIGGRFDVIDVKNEEFAGTFNTSTGTSANPGAFRTTGSSASEQDSGPSYSASLSYKLPYNIRPYLTYARSSVLLEGSNNRIANNVVTGGVVGKAELKEAGIKGSFFNNRLFLSTAAFEQSRLEVTQNEDPSLLTAEVSSTVSRGLDLEIRWLVMKGLNVSVFGQKETTKYAPNIGGTELIDARFMGFMDVKDSAGNVIYPAEAFLYGGRASIQIPDNLPQYLYKPANPEYQLGLNISYDLPSGFGVTLGTNYNSDVCAARLCVVKMPSVTTLNAGVHAKFRDWDVKLDVTNLTDEYAYRPRQYNGSAGELITAMPLARYNLTTRFNFK